jgi:hypothetical protein
MAIIVFRGVEVQVDPSEFCVELRKLFIDESSGIVWPKPTPSSEMISVANEIFGTNVKQRARPKGTIADIVRTNFTKVGVTKKIKANGDSAIRAAFYGEGWSARVIGTKRAGTFEVTRKS